MKQRYKYETTDGSTYELLKKNAKSNRRNPTPAESLLWEELRGRKLGVRFRRQHPIEGYIPDFVCLKKNQLWKWMEDIISSTVNISQMKNVHTT